MSAEVADRCVYFHRRPDTGDVFYVGMGGVKRSRQFNARNEYWRSVTADYGEPTVQIVSRGLTAAQAGEVERFWIAVFGYENLTNKSHGGEGSGGHIVSDETRRKLSQLVSGERHPLYGKRHTEETKRKIKESSVGRIVSDETRRKLSDALSGDKHPTRGKKLSDDHRSKVGRSGDKHHRYDATVYEFIHRDHGVVLATKLYMQKTYSLHSSHVGKLTRGALKSHGGWRVLAALNDNNEMSPGTERKNG